MLTKLAGGTIYDPVQGLDGVIADPCASLGMVNNIRCRPRTESAKIRSEAIRGQG